MRDEICEKIKENYAEAKVIAECLHVVRELEIGCFLKEVMGILQDELGSDWEVSICDISRNWGGLVLRHNKWIQHACVKLEAQGKFWSKPTVYGVIAPKDKFDRNTIKSRLGELEYFKNSSNSWSESNGWPFYQQIVDFSKDDYIQKLFQTEERDIFRSEIVTTLSQIAQSCKEIFLQES